MPSTQEIKQYLGGQAFGKTHLPQKDLSGKVYVVTGANTGLGFQTVKQLAALGASTIILACRSLGKGESAKAAIPSSNISSGIKLEVWYLDLSLNSSIVSFSTRLDKELSRLDGLIANVEMQESSLRTLSSSKVSRLESTARKYKIETNLSIVGSMQQAFAPYSQLQTPEIFRYLSNENTADMAGRYGLSKLMAQLCTSELARKLGATSSVIINVVNPGWCDTGLSDRGLLAGAIFRVIGRSAEDGGKTLVHAVTSECMTHGKYLSECQIKNVSDFARSKEGKDVKEALWNQLLDEISKVTGDPMSRYR